MAVRRASSRALDVARMVNVVAQGGGEAAGGPGPTK